VSPSISELVAAMLSRQRAAHSVADKRLALRQQHLLQQNAKLAAALGLRAEFRAGESVWVYRAPSTHSANTELGRATLSRKFLNYWHGPYEVLCVGPGSVGYGNDAAQVAANCLLIMREGQPVRVSVHLCKRCRDPTSSSDQPTGLPTGFARYLLTANPIGDAPPTSLDDNDASWESDRHGVEAVVDHRLVTQARGRASQLQYKVRWEGDALADTWEPAQYLDSCPEALREYWHQLALSSKSGAVVKGAATQVVRARMRQALLLVQPGRRLATAGKQHYKLPPNTIALEHCPDMSTLRSQCASGVRVLQVGVSAVTHSSSMRSGAKE
jgi:Chromo (CHRromatin Organisation MOdifier) domain